MNDDQRLVFRLPGRLCVLANAVRSRRIDQITGHAPQDYGFNDIGRFCSRGAFRRLTSANQ